MLWIYSTRGIVSDQRDLNAQIPNARKEAENVIVVLYI
jgi:hypothetical protein